MASNNINVGNESNDGNGQTLRDGFISVRKNLAEIFGITYTSDTQDLSGVNFSSDVVTEGLTNKYLLTNSVINSKMADDSVGANELINNSVGALALNVSGNGANGAVLKSDGDGTMSWIDPADTLAEVLALGNTTGGLDLAVSANDDITFTDSSEAIFGTGADLKIFHNGTNAEIVNTTGELNLKSETSTKITTNSTLALSIDASQNTNFFGPISGTTASFSTVAGGILSFGSLKDTTEDITITKFVDEADGLRDNDNNTTIPTSAAVIDYVTATPGVMNYKAIGLAMDYMSRVHNDGGTVEGMEQVMINTEKLILS